jgi:hypothetical protein
MSADVDTHVQEYLDGLEAPTALSSKSFVLDLKGLLPTTRNKYIVPCWNRIRQQYIEKDEENLLREAFLKDVPLTLDLIRAWTDTGKGGCFCVYVRL